MSAVSNLYCCILLLMVLPASASEWGSVPGGADHVPQVRVEFGFHSNIPAALKPAGKKVEEAVRLAVESETIRILKNAFPYMDWIDSSAIPCEKLAATIEIEMKKEGIVSQTIELSIVATAHGTRRSFNSNGWKVFAENESYPVKTKVAKMTAARGVREIRKSLAANWRKDFAKAIVVSREIDIHRRRERFNVNLAPERLNASRESELIVKFIKRVDDEDLEGEANLGPVQAQQKHRQRCSLNSFTYDGKPVNRFSKIRQILTVDLWDKVRVYIFRYVPRDVSTAEDP